MVPKRILRLPALVAKIGLKRSAIYERINPASPRYDPSFPKPIALGSGPNPPIGWVESEAEDWLATQVKKSRLVSA